MEGNGEASQGSLGDLRVLWVQHLPSAHPEKAQQLSKVFIFTGWMMVIFYDPSECIFYFKNLVNIKREKIQKTEIVEQI